MNLNILQQIIQAFGNVKVHPKTTILGGLAAVAVALTGAVDWKHALIAIAVALLGALAQDPNKGK